MLGEVDGVRLYGRKEVGKGDGERKGEREKGEGNREGKDRPSSGS